MLGVPKNIFKCLPRWSDKITSYFYQKVIFQWINIIKHKPIKTHVFDKYIDTLLDTSSNILIVIIILQFHFIQLYNNYEKSNFLDKINLYIDENLLKTWILDYNL